MKDKKEIMEYVRYITDTEHLTISQIREYTPNREKYNYYIRGIHDVDFYVSILCRKGPVTLIGHIVTSNYNKKEKSAILELQTY